MRLARPLSVLVVLLLLAGPAAAASPTILVLGDSLSAAYGIDIDQGWVSLLQKRLAARGYPHRVVNASISGDTSAGGLARLPGALASSSPAIVILELGANDGLRAQPTDRLYDNLASMITISRNADAKVLLLGMRIPPNYGPGYSRQFESVFTELAARNGLALIPFFLDNVAGERNLVQADGLHPTAAAQPVLLDNVWPELAPLLEPD